MKQLRISIIFTLFLFSVHYTFGQTHTKTYSNTNKIETDPNSSDHLYPSEILVDQGHAYIHRLYVDLRVVRHENLSELDILLETPQGERIILVSDSPQSGQYLLYNEIGTPGFHSPPINYGTPDDFDIIGSIDQPNPTLASVINTDPHGTWKLYVSDDTPNELHGVLNQGWKLTITSSPTPICIAPSIPVVDEIIDTTVAISWNNNEADANHDVRVYQFYSVSGQTRIDTLIFEDVEGDHFLVTGLRNDGQCRLSIRTDCSGDNTTTSNWTEYIEFRGGPALCRYITDHPFLKWFQFSSLSTYHNHYNFQVSCFGDSYDTKAILEFAPPEDGDYFINNSFPFNQIFYRPKSPCSIDNWTCLMGDNSKNNINIPNLSADTIYQLLYQTHYSTTNGMTSFISDCEMPENLHLDSTYTLFTEAKTYFSENGEPLTGEFDVFLMPQGGEIPTADSTPYYTDYYVNNGLIDFPTGSLDDDATYKIYIRKTCDLGPGYWIGPFQFTTKIYCGDEPLGVTINPRSITADVAIRDVTVGDYNNWYYVFSEAPLTPPEPTATGTVTNPNFSWYDLTPNTDYQFYLKRKCGDDDLQPWYGPYSFSTNSDCFVDVEDLFCQQCYRIPPNYGHSFFDGQNSLCYTSGTTFKERGEKIYRIRLETPGQIVLNRGQGFSPNENEVIYHFYLKSTSEICDLNNWEPIGCWTFAGGTSDIVINLEQDSTYYLMINFRSKSTSGAPDHEFTISGTDCYNTCPAVDHIDIMPIDSQSVIASWSPVPGAIGYDVALIPAIYDPNTLLWCKPHNFHYFQVINHPDTSFWVQEMEPDEEYSIVVRARCAPADYGPMIATDFQTSIDNTFTSLNVSHINYCSPYYARPVNTLMTNFSYDALEFTVSQDGYYNISQSMQYGSYMALYQGSFDPAHPENNLVEEITGGYYAGEVEPRLLRWLEANTTYTVVSTKKTQDGSNSFIRLTISGFNDVSSSGFIYKGRRAGPSGKLPRTKGILYASNNVCVDINGWRHYIKAQGGSTKFRDDLLLLSVKEYPEISNCEDDVLTLGGDYGTSLIPNTADNYVVNPDGWIVMNRFWNLDLNDECQPTSPVAIRFYYTDYDFEDIQSALPETIVTHDDLNFYKINDPDNIYDPDPSSGHINIPAASDSSDNGFWEYTYGPTPTTNHWSYGTQLGGHYAEMLIHEFSGGGAGYGSPIVSTKEIIKSTNWLLYPSPTFDRLNIVAQNNSSHIERLLIFNTEGKIWLNKKISNHTSKMTIDIGDFPTGLYFIKIYSADEIGIFRVVKVQR